MSKVLRPSDRVAVVGVIDPDVLTATTHDSGWVDMSDFERIMAVVMIGTLGEGAEFDAKLQQATDSSGTGVKDITGKAMTQMTEDTSPVDEDNQVVINCRADELDVTNSFTHVRLRITIGTASCDGAGLILGFDARQQPASNNDLASVSEIVA